MALTVYKQGDVVRRAGDAMDSLLFVVKGTVAANFLGQSFQYGQGSSVGLCGIFEGSYGMDYVAATDVTMLAKPYNGFSDFVRLLHSSEDIAGKVVSSFCRQISNLIALRKILKKEGQAAYELLTRLYPEYERLCGFYSFTAKKLDGADSVKRPDEGDVIEDWVQGYYPEILNLDAVITRGFFGNVGISAGFLRAGVRHFSQVVKSSCMYKEYLKDVSKMFLNSSEHDLLALLSELHVGSVSIKGADEAIGGVVAELKSFLSKMTGVDQKLLVERVGHHEGATSQKRENTGELLDAPEDMPATGGIKQNLQDSLYTILEYADMAQEDANKFARQISEFTAIRDRTSSDDVLYRLRRELTKGFYEIYTAVFLKSLNEEKVPTIIKMFLNFGYMDAELAGPDNADYLYSIADSYKGKPEEGIFTITEWLTAIYKGEKEPSQGDLDMDYALYVKETVQSARLDKEAAAKEEKRLLASNMGKLRFELESVFPIGNKITFGRVTTYCPVFADHNVQRNLKSSLVTADVVKATMNEILALDYSAFHREISFTDMDLGINNAQINVQVMPNFILMPNVGMRGAMWQDVEGRSRTTSARMFLPVFLLEDIKGQLLRLTGEFRWEIVKRSQGARWSDPSSPSLTSEYFTYLQFYRNNRELSLETKASVKTELMRARNVYRAVFVNNYIEWMMYECNGSQRLNKVARKLMFMYCPFPDETRKRLGSNPQYADALKLYDLKMRQVQQKLSNLMQKVTRENKAVPQEILNEMDFLQL
ncbi:MAG: cyclic nucleotide-binding domain-containing protein [Defluviitaleaceae bacterium]|nr:cyclic nucleotide-binding domain-containing protein [Defluviitaleaceae bacterium]